MERDKVAIIDKYNSIGLRDARVIRDSVYTIDEKHMGIDIFIEQGNPYYFGNIVWVGNTKYTDGQLDTIVGINRVIYLTVLCLNNVFMPVKMGVILLSVYMDRGHLFFNIQPVEVSIGEDNKINYEMRISEGKEARIRNINH